MAGGDDAIHSDPSCGSHPLEEEPQLLRRLIRASVSGKSYGSVLLLIVVTYGLSVSFRRAWSAPVVLLVQVATVWFTLRTSHARRAIRLTADVVLLAAAALAVIDALVETGGEHLSAIFAVGSLLYLMAPFSIVRHLIGRKVVDLETMLGAIAAYLLIGLSLAYVYRFLGALQSPPFFGASGAGTMSEDVFFSFTTLTTTGYGNLVPAGQPGQSLAVMEMIIGQLFLITAVGKVVSAWPPGTLGERQAARAESRGGLPLEPSE
jgi:hypothetical protein